MKALLIILLLVFAGIPALAQDQILYSSHPDELVVFLNDIAFARDEVLLPGQGSVQIVLPAQVYADTLVIREDGERVPDYRLRYIDNQLRIQWSSTSSAAVRQVTLDYLLPGVGWSPKYDMWLGADEAETVDLDFFAEIRNNALNFEDVAMRLVAGQVDTSQAVGESSTVTMNQYLAGYDDALGGAAGSFTGSATIQHIYEIGSLSADVGETVFTRLDSGTLPARRLHLWNAPAGNLVTVIYKVTNELSLPIAEGIVRSYQNGLFVGSDFIELTPIGGEGSVTVGNLQNVRANRSETQRAIAGNSDRDLLHEVVLTLENFGDESVVIEVVDRYPTYALDFEFSQEAQPEGDNVLRWVVTVASGEEAEIRYSFKD